MSLNYTVRESHRAKHVSLKISITGELEVIVPKGFNPKNIPEILQKKRRWIDRVTRRMETQRALVGVDASEQYPDRVILSAIAEDWQIDYHPNHQLGIRAIEHSRLRLRLQGNTQDAEICKIALRQWVVHKARLHLLPWLRHLSQEYQLPYKQATIRQQKTLWGSCSARKTISLNCKLLFLPDTLVRYVLLHELCHTIHLNHSAEFWALVERYEPDYAALDASLRDARYLVPPWME